MSKNTMRILQDKRSLDISLLLNMTRSEDVQSPLDISVSTKAQYGNRDSLVASLPQYDKVFVIAKETSASPCFASKSLSLAWQSKLHLLQATTSRVPHPCK